MTGRLVVAVTGASGTMLARSVLLGLGEAGIERHLVLSAAGHRTASFELPGEPLSKLAEVVYSWRDIGAPIASGSYPTDGMLVVPCSIRTLSSIAYGISDTLLTRAADVTLKERRRLVLSVRETPLHLGHLRAMVAATEAGAIVAPPMPAFYDRPATVDELVDQMAARLLGLFGVPLPGASRWAGDGRRTEAGQARAAENGELGEEETLEDGAETTEW
jgi:polyprenyl P-hydroxybenzoate/phenylacrylic acid decarboxylase-like protein